MNTLDHQNYEHTHTPIFTYQSLVLHLSHLSLLQIKVIVLINCRQLSPFVKSQFLLQHRSILTIDPYQLNEAQTCLAFSHYLSPHTLGLITHHTLLQYSSFAFVFLAVRQNFAVVLSTSHTLPFFSKAYAFYRKTPFNRSVHLQ